MNEENRELMFELLTKKVVYGLDEREEFELARFEPDTTERELRSLEMTAAAISLIDLSPESEMPAHLRAGILESAEPYISNGKAQTAAWPPPVASAAGETPRSGGFGSLFGWLGWAAAAAACIALAINVWYTRSQIQTQTAKVERPIVEKPRELTPAEMRDEMMRSNVEMVKANWAAGNVKNMKQISGDVVWSDEKQAGYMRLRGLPKNDRSKETYQLWIFDKTQDKATPIDGGTFDVPADGEVVIPINAKLKAERPEMFAITVEKPGGVVVSKREKIAALAKVETPSA